MLDSCPTPWKSLYPKTLQETDPAKLTQIVVELEELMIQRGLELTGSSEDEHERADLRLAASQLLKIKIEKLGWPGI